MEIKKTTEQQQEVPEKNLENLMDEMEGGEQFSVFEMTDSDDWIVFEKDGEEEICPAPILLEEYVTQNPAPPPQLIQGVLRKEHKMLLSAASKAGKTELLMELAVAIACGKPWLGFPCKQDNVLYVNMELDHASAARRLRTICKVNGVSEQNRRRIALLNLRGIDVPLNQIDEVIRQSCIKMREMYGMKDVGAIIIDPIYKLLNGDENSAAVVNQFCHVMDRIAENMRAAVIYAHHHSKGSKGNTRAMDRSSGSGVFARDVDALLDLIQLDLPKELQEMEGNERLTAWRMEAVLREFPEIKPINLFFRFPIHELDTEGRLDQAAAAGGPGANLSKSSKRVSAKNRKQSVEEAFQALNQNGEPVTIKALANKIGVSDRCVRDRLKVMEDTFWVKAGLVGRKAG